MNERNDDSSGVRLTAEQSAYMEMLYRRYHTYLLRFLQRMEIDGMNVNDIAQDAYYRLARTENVTELEYPRAFLFKIAVNLVNDYTRGLRRHHTEAHIDIANMEGSTKPEADTTEGIGVLQSSVSSPERILQGQQELAIMRSVLEELAPKHQAIIAMSKFQNFSHKRIAEKLNFSVSMVEKVIRKTTRLVRQRILETREPSAKRNKEPSAKPNKEPSAKRNKEPSAEFGKEPSAKRNKEPSAEFGKKPSAEFGKKLSAEFGRTPKKSHLNPEDTEK